MSRPMYLGYSRERGQAVVESLVAMVVMLALYAAVSWLGRFQDMALQATHASRFAAFSLARNASLRPIAQIRRRYFSGPAHQWTASDGNPVLSDRQSEATLTVSPGQPLGPQALPGGTDSSAAALRHGLRLGGPGIRHAHVLLRFAGSDSGSTTATAQGAAFPDAGGAYPSLARQTAILTDAGHASNDAHAQIGRAHV